MENVIFGTIPDGSGYGSGYGDGYGDGYGSGSGDGDGSGYGDGDGYGSGSGDGDGSGDGSGYGDGDGYGSGDGDGYGSGSGDGDGYGSGSGDGDKSYWSSVVDAFASQWTVERRSRLEVLRSQGAAVAFWKSAKDGRPCNGGSGDPVQPGTVHESPGPLRQECGAGQLHGTLLPHKWKGERLWVVALLGEVVHGDDKMWSLKREIIAEAICPQ